MPGRETVPWASRWQSLPAETGLARAVRFPFRFPLDDRGATVPQDPPVDPRGVQERA